MYDWAMYNQHLAGVIPLYEKHAGYSVVMVYGTDMRAETEWSYRKGHEQIE